MKVYIVSAPDLRLGVFKNNDKAERFATAVRQRCKYRIVVEEFELLD